VSEAPGGKFLGFLDQLLPFLAVCPPWLRLWVHALIVLNFLTIACLAIFYLSSKEKATDEGSLKYFSVVTPTDGQQIPLSDSNTWMINGTLPKSKDADFRLQVIKLPDGESIPQTGEKFKSTLDGNWSFEPAKFAGFGTYEIKATGMSGGDSLVRTVKVTCYDKATAYQLSIEREKKFRTGANIGVMPADVPGGEVIEQVAQLQNDYVAAISAEPMTEKAWRNALGIVNQALDLIDSTLPVRSNDFDLQSARAFFLKDYAQVAQELKLPEAGQAMDEARIMFEAVAEQHPNDTNTWNGLGTLYMMSGQPAKAIFYIRRALKIAPDNPYAQHDLAVATQQAQQQQAEGK
jgi:tetratricopeptide (TPR) repeat protein